LKTDEVKLDSASISPLVLSLAFISTDTEKKDKYLVDTACNPPEVSIAESIVVDETAEVFKATAAACDIRIPSLF
jgi:hypothetical protein